MSQHISLPDRLAEKATTVAQSLGLSLEELLAIALEELLIKYQQAPSADLNLEQKMKVAQRGIKKYQQALAELAQ
ncbi:hypothetical protein NIES970_15530 [[Synechococcus] sp. NIES-970]|nr:hypothetical protein NIES970_15530 [[Synechococcus] sp. NIES-970]